MNNLLVHRDTCTIPQLNTSDKYECRLIVCGSPTVRADDIVVLDVTGK